MVNHHAQRVYGAPLKRPRKITKPLSTNVSDDLSGKRIPAYEEALRRRDFQMVLWMIADSKAPAIYETVGGETALLAAIEAKDREAVTRILAWYDYVRFTLSKSFAIYQLTVVT